MSARARRVISRICIAVSLALLLALVVFAPLRHHAPLGGAGIAAAALVSIAGSLVYLRGARGRR